MVMVVMVEIVVIVVLEIVSSSSYSNSSNSGNSNDERMSPAASEEVLDHWSSSLVTMHVEAPPLPQKGS